jgi:hypothetical protein
MSKGQNIVRELKMKGHKFKSNKCRMVHDVEQEIKTKGNNVESNKHRMGQYIEWE